MKIRTRLTIAALAVTGMLSVGAHAQGSMSGMHNMNGMQMDGMQMNGMKGMPMDGMKDMPGMSGSVSSESAPNQADSKPSTNKEGGAGSAASGTDMHGHMQKNANHSMDHQRQ